MAKKQAGKGKRRVPKTVLRLPDLDQAKSAVLNSLSSIDAQRGYRHAIEFIEWYCSEPRLSFSKTVVLRDRIHLESRHLAPGTINLRPGAVSRLAYEASDFGMLFRRVNKNGKAWGDGLTEKAIWHVVREYIGKAGIERLAPHDLRRTCARLCHAAGGELEQIQFLLGHVSIQTTERYLGCKQRIRSAVNDRIGIEPES